MNYTTIARISLIAATIALASCGNSTSSPAPSSSSTSTSSPKVETAAATVKTPEELGKKVYARCRTCHTLEQGGRHRVGPNLWGIFGKTSGTTEGFAFSKAMKEAAIVWDEQSISDYVESPKTFMPGNKMVFVGLKKQVDRDNLIAYMKAETQPK